MDQYGDHDDYVKELPNGERVIISHELTANRISLIYYLFVNLGALLAIPTSYAAKFVGFWLAFLIPGIFYLMLPILLIVSKPYTKIGKPQGSELDRVFKIVAIALKRNKGQFWKKDFFQSAKPSRLEAAGIKSFRNKPISWNDRLVDDVQRTLKACVMFLWFPIWYLNDGGMGNISNTLTGIMTKGSGATNDVIGYFNPITLMIFVPLLTYVIYPALVRFNAMPGRITRITIGFTLAWLSGLYGAVLQWRAYETHPCGYWASTMSRCPQDSGKFTRCSLRSLNYPRKCGI